MPVYFIQSGDSGPVKIGLTKDVRKRLSGLQTNHPEPLRVRRLLEGGTDVERALHARFAAHRQKGEWFAPDPEILTADTGFTELPVSDALKAPNNERRGWTAESYERLYASRARSALNPANAEKIKAVAARTGAIRSMTTGMRDAAKIIGELRSADLKGVMRLRRLADLRMALVRMERAHSIFPRVISYCQGQDSEGAGGSPRRFLKQLAEMQACLAAHGAHAPDRGAAP